MPLNLWWRNYRSVRPPCSIQSACTRSRIRSIDFRDLFSSGPAALMELGHAFEVSVFLLEVTVLALHHLRMLRTKLLQRLRAISEIQNILMLILAFLLLPLDQR